MGYTYYALLPSMYIFYVCYSTLYVHKWVFSYVTLCTKLMVILPISIWLSFEVLFASHNKLRFNGYHCTPLTIEGSMDNFK